MTTNFKGRGFLSKIRVEGQLKHQDECFYFDGTGILLKDKIIYRENDMNVTLKKEKNIVKLTRKNEEYQMNMIFEKGKKSDVFYEILKESLKTYLQVETNVLEWENDRVKIEYVLFPTNESFSYQLKIEVIK